MKLCLTLLQFEFFFCLCINIYPSMQCPWDETKIRFYYSTLKKIWVYNVFVSFLLIPKIQKRKYFIFHCYSCMQIANITSCFSCIFLCFPSCFLGEPLAYFQIVFNKREKVSFISLETYSLYKGACPFPLPFPLTLSFLLST